MQEPPWHVLYRMNYYWAKANTTHLSCWTANDENAIKGRKKHTPRRDKRKTTTTEEWRIRRIIEKRPHGERKATQRILADQTDGKCVKLERLSTYSSTQRRTRPSRNEKKSNCVKKSKARGTRHFSKLYTRRWGWRQAQTYVHTCVYTTHGIIHSLAAQKPPKKRWDTGK